MSDFKVIETQVELDNIIQGRLDRQKESFEKQLGDYDQLKTRNEELEKEVGALKTAAEESKNAASQYDQTISELNEKVTSYETANLRTRIAIQNGLPLDLADRLVGEDEDSLKADAERLSGFVGKKQPTPPLKSTEPIVETDEDADLKAMLKKLNERGE